MSRYRKIDMRLYGDDKYRRLSPCPPCGQAMWWYLIAGEQTGQIPGLFKIGELSFADQLGWTLKGFREAFGEVFREGMVKADWKARLVWVPNSIKYNAPANPNVIKSWTHAWDELPECDLKGESYQRLMEATEALGKGFGKAFREACRKPFGKSLANQEQEQEQEQDQEEEKIQTRTFQKPTLEEVQAHCLERKNSIDPVTFWNHYESNGWVVGKAKMKNWKAAIVTWERNSASKNGEVKQRCMTDEEKKAWTP